MKEGLAQPAPFFRLPFIFSFNDYWKDTFKKVFQYPFDLIGLCNFRTEKARGCLPLSQGSNEQAS